MPKATGASFDDFTALITAEPRGRVSPNAAPRKGDRVVLRTADGEVMAKILVRRTAKTIELASLNPANPNLVFPLDCIEWIARIIWASQ